MRRLVAALARVPLNSHLHVAAIVRAVGPGVALGVGLQPHHTEGELHRRATGSGERRGARRGAFDAARVDKPRGEEQGRATVRDGEAAAQLAHIAQVSAVDAYHRTARGGADHRADREQTRGRVQEVAQRRVGGPGRGGELLAIERHTHVHGAVGGDGLDAGAYDFDHLRASIVRTRQGDVGGAAPIGGGHLEGAAQVARRGGGEDRGIVDCDPQPRAAEIGASNGHD